MAEDFCAGHMRSADASMVELAGWRACRPFTVCPWSASVNAFAAADLRGLESICVFASLSGSQAESEAAFEHLSER
jgi:hypothetical protein